MRGKSATQQNGSASLPVNPILINEPEKNQSFWENLQENKAKIFLCQKICVFLVAFLVFANGIPNGFNVDDTYYTTKENPVARMGIKAIPKIFTTLTFHDNSNNSFDYRPIPMLTFVIQHQFLGDTPPISHFINVLIYSLVCLFIFTLLCLWFGPSKSWFAFFVTLLYAVHPLHTEVVDNIKNRDELLATFFCLSSMITAWKWHKTNKNGYFVLAFFLYIIGLLSKTSIIFYAAIVPMAFYFFTDMPVRKIILVSVTIFVVPYFLVGIYRDIFLPEQTRVFLFFENPLYVTHVPLEVRIATASYILGWYLYLHVIPYPLSFFYGYKYVRFLYWNNWMAIASIIPYLLLIFFILKNIRKKTIAVFGALFYVVCLLPYSNLFFSAPGMMAERFTFDSSLGYSILIVSFLYYLYKVVPDGFLINKNSKYLLATFSFFFISYAAMSMVRNTEWKNYWVLYSHDIKHLQNSVKANMFYGEQVSFKMNLYRAKYNQATGAEKDIYRDSIALYEREEKAPFLRALAVYPGYDDALNYLAAAYIHEDSFEKAKDYLLQTRIITPNNPDVRYNLAVIFERLAYSNVSLLDSSIKEFKTTISINPKSAAAYGELSQVYLIRKDTTLAISDLISGIRKIPDMPFLYMQLANIYLYKKDTLQGIYYYEKGAAVPNTYPPLLIFLENYYRNKNDTLKENYYKNKISTFRYVNEK